MKPMAIKKHAHQTMFRHSSTLHQALKDSAEANARSVNDDMHIRLTASFVTAVPQPYRECPNILAHLMAVYA